MLTFIFLLHGEGFTSESRCDISIIHSGELGEKKGVPLSLSLGKQACMAARFAFYLGGAVGGTWMGGLITTGYLRMMNGAKHWEAKHTIWGQEGQGGILAFGVVLEEGRDAAARCVVWMGGGVQGWGGWRGSWSVSGRAKGEEGGGGK
jgi:hypothetical protein